MIAHAVTPILNVSSLDESLEWFVKLGWQQVWDRGTPPPFGCVASGAVQIFLCALRRGINVGGHTVRMSELRVHFESLGYSGVETHIASANGLFETKQRARRALETTIARRLADVLGYEVATFVRTPAEIAATVA